VIVYHVAITTADDYLTRREAHRQTSFEHLMGLRAHGMIIAAGPAPDGRSCDLFCRVQQPGDIEKVVQTSPLFVDGLWTGYSPRSFAEFLEPWELPPPRPDETRLATLVEGATPDAEMASFVFIEERGAGRLLFGGFFPDGSSLAFMTSADPAAAIAPLDASGLFTTGTLRARPLLHIL
jgi:uncharacterized protein YciI